MYWAAFIFVGDFLKILIDDREDKKRVIYIKNNFNAPISVERLDVGDIIISQKEKPTIAIEVKTIQDFIGSIKNRRIQKEALQMKAKYPFSFIVIYDDGNWNREYVNCTINEYYGNIVSLNQRYKVPVIQCGTPKQFITVLKSIIKNVNKDDEPISPPTVRKKSSNEMINVLIGLPKVGEKMARTLLDIFRTPGAVFKATDEELDEVPRLQKVSKNAIKRMR